MFAASGDSGSYDCQRSDFADHRLSVDFPASSPQAVAVGGTLLSVGTDGSYAGEAGWEAPALERRRRRRREPARPRAELADGGRRGRRPSRRARRQSASASPDSGWVTRDYGKWDTAGGTSAATPFWAASMLLAEQYAAKHGVTRRCFLAPILYRLATSDPSAFHDVRTGGNRYYDAHPGWDYATGLGSPDVSNLSRALTSYLRAHPCPAAS